MRAIHRRCMTVFVALLGSSAIALAKPPPEPPKTSPKPASSRPEGRSAARSASAEGGSLPPPKANPKPAPPLPPKAARPASASAPKAAPPRLRLRPQGRSASPPSAPFAAAACSAPAVASRCAVRVRQQPTSTSVVYCCPPGQNIVGALRIADGVAASAAHSPEGPSARLRRSRVLLAQTTASAPECPRVARAAPGRDTAVGGTTMHRARQGPFTCCRRRAANRRGHVHGRSRVRQRDWCAGPAPRGERARCVQGNAVSYCCPAGQTIVAGQCTRRQLEHPNHRDAFVPPGSVLLIPDTAGVVDLPGPRRSDHVVLRRRYTAVADGSPPSGVSCQATLSSCARFGMAVAAPRTSFPWREPACATEP